VKFDGPIRHPLLGGSTTTTLSRIARFVAGRPAAELGLWRRAQERYGTTRRALRAGLLALPCQGFDIVHFAYSGIAAAWLDALPLLAPARLVTSCRGSAERITPLVDPQRAEQLREVFAKMDRVHCVSLDMQQTCASYGLDPSKAFVNHPAIHASAFTRSSPYPARTTGPFRLVSTGRLHWAKGLEFALLAVAQLRAAGQDVHYDLIGSGPDESRLRYAARELGLAEYVTFRGNQSIAEVRTALEAGDVYLLASVSEGISNAVLEAMAMQLTVVTTDAGGMIEAVRHGIDGLVVPTRDPAAIAHAIATLLAEPARRIELGQAARRRVESDFTLARQIETFEREYRSLL
jgi:colanic acid/amylovoran biosynthesis glycosyltransferase